VARIKTETDGGGKVQSLKSLMEFYRQIGLKLPHD